MEGAQLATEGFTRTLAAGVGAGLQLDAFEDAHPGAPIKVVGEGRLQGVARDVLCTGSFYAGRFRTGGFGEEIQSDIRAAECLQRFLR